MKSLVKKTQKEQKQKENKSKKPQALVVTQTTRTEAQCCAKVAKTVAGCHD